MKKAFQAEERYMSQNRVETGFATLKALEVVYCNCKEKGVVTMRNEAGGVGRGRH